MGLIFIITCMDIAVDSWAIELLHPCNSSYGSACQSVGIRLGSFVSTSLFISLNSPEFCSTWIYGTDSEPVLTLSNYMLAWVVVQVITTIWVAFFVPEVD